MKCPACERNLTEVTAGNITVNACQQGCGGIWFNRFELKKIIDPKESSGEALLDIERDKDVHVDLEARKKCPTCKNMIMMRHFFSPQQAVEVEECPKCGGHWLDYGELGAIRDQYTSEADQVKAAKAYFAEIYDYQLAQMGKATKEQSEKIRTISGIFRFITPSWYLGRK